MIDLDALEAPAERVNPLCVEADCPQVGKPRSGHCGCYREWANAQSKLEYALRNALPELLSLARDGQRYRWLRSPNTARKHREEFYHRTCEVCQLSEGELDAAIDAAMKEGR